MIWIKWSKKELIQLFIACLVWSLFWSYFPLTNRHSGDTEINSIDMDFYSSTETEFWIHLLIVINNTNVVNSGSYRLLILLNRFRTAINLISSHVNGVRYEETATLLRLDNSHRKLVEIRFADWIYSIK